MGWIVFASDRDGDFEIYKKKADGTGEVLQLTNNHVMDYQPAWSPSGRRIAFVRRGSGDIYTMWADGSHVKRRTSYPTDDVNPAWSPDGKRIAYGAIEFDGGDLIELTLKTGSDRGLVWQEENSMNSQPTYSPTGRVAFIELGFSWNEIGFVTDDASDPNFVSAPEGKEVRDPSWSPDGQLIAFDGSDYDESPDPLASKLDRDLFVMAPDGSHGYRLEEEASESEDPEWSQDGRWLVFQSDRAGTWDLHLMDMETRTVVLFESSVGRDIDPDWVVRR